MEVNIKKFIKKVIVVDASILVKIFFNEEGSEFVGNLIIAHRENKLTLLASPLIIFEVMNAVAKGWMNFKEVEEVYKELKNLKLGIVGWEDFDCNFAIKAACEHKMISFYDASYHSLAKDMGDVFLTADKKYFKEMEKYGNVELLENYL